MCDTVSRCLNNSLILQKILKSFDLLANLQFRLVDRRFNQEILHQIRVSHRKINIYVEVERLPNIVLNGSFVNTTDSFTFLVNTAGVRVQELRICIDKNVENTITNRLHAAVLDILLKDQTLNVFEGMNELTDSCCNGCLKNAMRSKEYGPAHQRILYNSQFLKKQKHFNRLIIDDRVMWAVACVCQLEMFSKPNTWEQFEKNMNKYINSNITCDHLQLAIYNHPDFFEDGSISPIEASAPRELLEKMCTEWRPKSIGLSVISLVTDREWQAHWTVMNQFQTEFQFYDPYWNTRVSRGFVLDYVNVDMDNAPLKEIFKENLSLFDDNLIANVRKVFPARHYFVNLHRMSVSHRLDQYRFEQLIKAVMMGTSQSNTSPVTLRYSIDITAKPFDIPETLSIKGRVFTCLVSRESIEDVYRTRRIAKCFRICEEKTGLEVNLEIYVDKKQLKEVFEKHTELGFFKYYLNE